MARYARDLNPGRHPRPDFRFGPPGAYEDFRGGYYRGGGGSPAAYGAASRGMRPPPAQLRREREQQPGEGGYDRIYGGWRAARYGDRYDMGYAPLSPTNPLARRLGRGRSGLGPEGAGGPRGW